MTHEEMIAIIQADKDGKTIQFRPNVVPNAEWIDCMKESEFIKFNFHDYDFRIKSEPRYRPFKNAEEVMEAIKEHGYYIKWGGDGKDYIIAVVCDDYIEPYNDESYTFAEAFESFTWPDGTPFGVKED